MSRPTQAFPGWEPAWTVHGQERTGVAEHTGLAGRTALTGPTGLAGSTERERTGHTGLTGLADAPNSPGALGSVETTPAEPAKKGDGCAVPLGPDGPMRIRQVHCSS